MKLFAIFFLIFTLNRKVAESAHCYYHDMGEFFIRGYTCGFKLKDDSESNGNFTSIDGSHYRSDDKVKIFRDYYSHHIKVLPPIICEKFGNLQAIWLHNVKMEKIFENSLTNCKHLIYIDISQNKITKLPANVFASQSELDILYLYENLIEELPANVFVPLKNLRILSLNDNRLTTLNSNSFGALPKFKEFYFQNNALSSFDERIIDINKALTKMNGSKNNCTEGNFNDEIEGRDQLRVALKNCFENYVEP